MISITIETAGIKNIDAIFEQFPVAAAKSMSIAINEVARGAALDLAREAIRRQVAFPEGYLGSDRLFVSKFATPTDLQAIVTGRDRATSLARFSIARPASGGAVRARGRQPAGQTVTVRPGTAKLLPTAFFIGLQNDNVGLAIRLRPGESISDIHAYKPQPLFRNRTTGETEVWLLYGPSVQQVFQGVAGDIAPQVTEALELEFNRQFAFRA